MRIDTFKPRIDVRRMMVEPRLDVRRMIVEPRLDVRRMIIEPRLDIRRMAIDHVSRRRIVTRMMINPNCLTRNKKQCAKYETWDRQKCECVPT